MKPRSAGVALLSATLLAAAVLGAGNAAAATDSDARTAPTPAAATDQLTGDIVFSRPSGTFTGELAVSLSTAIADAEVRYTTDGQLPGPEAKLYAGTPVRVTTTTRLRAQAFVDGEAAGDPGTALYVASSVTTRHDLPVVVVDTFNGGRLTKDTYQDAAVLTFEPGDGPVALSQAPTLVSRAGFRLRGQSSSTFPKQSYKLELHDNADKDAALPFLGMPADGDWAFRGPYLDKSLIRDAFTFGLGRDMGRLSTPRVTTFELYLNRDGGALTAADYVGVYVATETVEISKDRLDITKMKKTDVTAPAVQGGYVFKFDKQAAEEPMLKCTGPAATCWKYLEVVEPDPLQPEQQAWLTDYVQRFNDVLLGDDFADPENGYAAWIDVPSFVDYVIVNELSRNVDGYQKSAYFHKDRSGKLVAGPLWDYDISYGTGGIRHNLDADGWQYAENAAIAERPNVWFPRLAEDPAFASKLAARWQELRRGVLADAAMDRRIDELAAPLTNAAARNFQKWNNLTQARLVNWATTPTMPTWEGQVEYTRDWIHERAAWLDTQWR
jgi:CotH kinase protein/Chitobiase/beta-hexosaminidase C-terminal domain